MNDRDRVVVGIDELLERAAPPREKEKPRSGPFTGRWWLTRILLSAALAGGLYAVLYGLGVKVPYPLLGVAVLALTVLQGALKRLEEEPLPAELTGKGLARVLPDEPETRLLRSSVQPGDGLRFAVERWEDRLSWGDRDASRFASIVLPRIGELADERLRQRHGLTRASDPHRARQLLGEEAWQFLHTRPRRKVNPRDVASIVAKVEGL